MGPASSPTQTFLENYPAQLLETEYQAYNPGIVPVCYRGGEPMQSWGPKEDEIFCSFLKRREMVEWHQSFQLEDLAFYILCIK